MKKIVQHFLPVVLLLAATTLAWSQSSPNCATASDDNYLTGKAYFNYGSVSNSFNTKHRANITVGQPVIGSYFGQTHKGAFGFWASFLLPPKAPYVMASEGDLEDRVQIDWAPDPLSPASTGYKIYRNGSLLASVDGQTFSFLDFNVIAGKFYTYEVSGVSSFGEGSKGSSLGFLNPNGVVTGQVKSFSNNPVPGAIVTLTPALGAALEFDGTDDMAFAEYLPAYPRNEFTISCWVKLGDGNDGAGVRAYIFKMKLCIFPSALFLLQLHTPHHPVEVLVQFGGEEGIEQIDAAHIAIAAKVHHGQLLSWPAADIRCYWPATISKGTGRKHRKPAIGSKQLAAGGLPRAGTIGREDVGGKISG
jgi:hypothetical protein